MNETELTYDEALSNCKLCGKPHFYFGPQVFGASPICECGPKDFKIARLQDQIDKAKIALKTMNDKWCNRVDRVAELRDQLDTLRWIPISEELPKETGVYFVSNDEWGQDAYWDGALWRDYEGGDAVDFSPLKLTHWKPITLPKGDKHESD